MTDLNKLRAQLQAKQRPGPVTLPQAVQCYANKDVGLVYLRFNVPADHLQYTLDEAKSQVKDLIAGCVYLGAKVKQELQWE